MPLTKNKFLIVLTVLLCILATGVAFFGLMPKPNTENNQPVFAAAGDKTITISGGGNASTYIQSWGTNSATLTTLNQTANLTFTVKNAFANYDFSLTQSTDIVFDEIDHQPFEQAGNFSIVMSRTSQTTYLIRIEYTGSSYETLPNSIGVTYTPTTPTFGFSYNVTPADTITPSFSGLSSGNTVATYGTAISFTLSATTGYTQLNELSVKYRVGTGSQTNVSKSGNTYTISGTSITNNIEVFITVSKNTYTLTMPATQTGYNATVISDGGTTLTHGVAHRFMVELQTGYTNTVPEVGIKVGSGSTTGLSASSSNGVIYYYTINASSVVNNIEVFITATLNKFTFNIPASGPGFTAAATSGITNTNKATYNTDVVFTVTLAAKYNLTEPTVTYSMNGGTVTLSKTGTSGTNGYIYTVNGSNIIGDITISIETTKNVYTISTNLASGVTLTYISGFKTTSPTLTAEVDSTIQFSLISPTGYDCVVQIGGTTATASNNVYSKTITSNTTITVTTTPKTYIFTGADGEGYTFAVTAGVSSYSNGTGTITHDSSNIGFTVTLLSGYTSSTPVVTYRVNGGAATTLSGSRSGNVFTYSIAKANVVGNIQIFVSDVRMQAYTVTANVSSTYVTFEGESTAEHGKAYIFTLTLKAAYTQSDISSGYVNYSVGGATSSSLTGSLMSGSTATYRFTIPSEQTTGSIIITFSGTLSKNTYTVTVSNTKSIRSYSYDRTDYYYANDSATNVSQGYNVQVFAFLFSMGSANFKTHVSGNTTYYPSYACRTSSKYYSASFSYEHGSNVVIYVRSYMLGDGYYLQQNTSSEVAEREVVIRSANSATPTRYNSTTQTNNYTISSSINSDYEITIGLKVATVEFHTVDDYKTSVNGFPSTYTTQIPLTESEVNTRDAAGTLDINQYAGYTFTSASTSVVSSGDSYTLQLTLLTSKGFSGTPVVKYWYKLRSGGSYSSSGTEVASSGNNTYNIPANATYSDIYVSVTGIVRTQYAVSLPSSDNTKGFSTAHTTLSPVTYYQNYDFSITVLRDNGWYCSNRDLTSDDLATQLGTPVVRYVMNGEEHAISHTTFQQATSGINITYSYSLQITGAAEISISGLEQQTFSVSAIYEDQTGVEYATENGSVTTSEFSGGQITPISNLTIPYGGTFRFSVYVNTQDGWNGNGMTARARLASALTYTTLTKQSDGSYIYAGPQSNGITEDFVIKISGIVSDSYYISLPITDGITLEATSGTQYVLKGNDFSFNATVRADQGWSAGSDNSDLVVKYYSSSTYSSESLLGTLVGTYQGDFVTSYTITNVQNSIYVRVEGGLVQAKFRASISTTDASYTTNINPEQDIIYGSVYQFTVTVSTGYDPSTLAVWYKMEGVHDDFVLLSETNGVYRTVQTTGNILIKIDAADLLVYHAICPTPSGYTITYNTGSDPDLIPYGTNFSFNITKLVSHEGTPVVRVTREGVIETETISPLEGTGGTYVITNVISNFSVDISGLSLKTFEISFTNGDGYTVDPVGKALTNNKVTVEYGEQLQFKLSITPGYNGAAPSVTDTGGASYTPSSGIYTVSDYVSNVAVGIIQTHSIVISGIELNTYTISLPSSTVGYNIAYDSELDLNIIPYNTNFVFTVDVLEAYQKTATFSVKASVGGSAETPLTPNGNGEYTINNIQSNIIISVAGVERKTYSVTTPTDAGYTINRVDGDVSYGNDFTFSININTVDGYYEIETGVVVTYQTYNTSTASWNAPQVLNATRGIYTISNITSNISVAISGIIRGEYKMTLPSSMIGYSIVDQSGDAFNEETLTIDYNGVFAFKVNVDSANGYFKGTDFKVSYKVTNSDTTPTRINENGGLYSIAPITNNLVIYVEGVEMTYYTITLPEEEARIGYTIYTNDQTSVAFKQSFTFSVNVDTQNGYDASTLAVYYMIGTDRVQLNTISSYTYQMNGITQNRAIVIRAPSLQKFNINIPTENGFEIESENTSNVVDYGADYSFSVNIDTINGYNSNNMKVYCMPEGQPKIELTADNEIYTVSNIKTNISILVEGVALNQYEITLQNITGLAYWNNTGNSQITETQYVNFGDNFEFKVVLDSLYNKSTITVYNNDIAINMNAKNNYVLSDITQDCQITVSGVLMNQANYSSLQSALEISPTYQESYYTTETLNNFKIARQNAQATLEETYYQNDQYIIDNTTNALIAALDGLQLRPADYSALNAAMLKVPEDLYKYTEQSRLALMAAMKVVKMDLDITQQDIVNGYVSVVLDATEGLVPTEEQVNLIQESNFLLYLVGGASVCIIIAMLIIMFIDHKKRSNMAGEVFNKKLAKQASANATNGDNGNTIPQAPQSPPQMQQNTYAGHNSQQQNNPHQNQQVGAQSGYNNPYRDNQNQNGTNQQ